MNILKSEVEEFRTENNLGKKSTRLILEAWRRFYMKAEKHEGKELKNMWLGLGFGSAYEKGPNMFKPVQGYNKGKLVWWSLTELGESLFKTLDKKIRWNYRYSQMIYDGAIL